VNVDLISLSSYTWYHCWMFAFPLERYDRSLTTPFALPRVAVPHAHLWRWYCIFMHLITPMSRFICILYSYSIGEVIDRRLFNLLWYQSAQLASWFDQILVLSSFLKIGVGGSSNTIPKWVARSCDWSLATDQCAPQELLKRIYIFRPTAFFTTSRPRTPKICSLSMVMIWKFLFQIPPSVSKSTRSVGSTNSVDQYASCLPFFFVWITLHVYHSWSLVNGLLVFCLKVQWTPHELYLR